MRRQARLGRIESGLAKRLGSTSLLYCAACKSDASGFWGLHETGNHSLGRLTLWGNERGVVLLFNIW